LKNNAIWREQILELRNQGKSYRMITKILKCSSSTVAYNCNKEVEEKVKSRMAYRRGDNKLTWKLKLQKQVSSFNYRKAGKGHGEYNKDWNKKLRTSYSTFMNRGSKNTSKVSYKAVIEKFGLRTRCYLTGKKIDLTKDDYSFDHIVPVAKGGENTLDNLGITIPIVNRSKTDLTKDEYIELCKKILKYNGYSVTKRKNS